MKKVYVGMSGGVDSSLSAALLKEQGHSVTGVFMKNWTQDIAGWPCPWREDYRDAKRVALQLDIPFKIFDFQKEYKHKVVDYMVSEYKLGHTPNPDIMCNQEIKFKLFFETAREDGAEFIATGHYARVMQGLSSQKVLAMGADRNKDQSYFLYRISQNALDHTLFPIGAYSSKDEVRKEAKKRGLSTASKPDSQGICFVGEVGIKEFLSEFAPQTKGNIVDENGRIIGEHDGAVFYTLGQRQGLNVGGGLPYYVTKIDVKSNTVYASRDLNDKNLWTKKLNLTNTHWFSEPKENEGYHIRTRHRGELILGTVFNEKNGSSIRLEEPIRAPSPGQSAVVYKDEVVLGGGIITG